MGRITKLEKRVEALEKKLAELELQLAEQPKKENQNFDIKIVTDDVIKRINERMKSVTLLNV